MESFCYVGANYLSNWKRIYMISDKYIYFLQWLLFITSYLIVGRTEKSLRDLIFTLFSIENWMYKDTMG